MKYFPKITGERIYLSPVCADDAEIYTKWLNDPAVALGLGNYDTVVSLGAEKKYLEEPTKDGYVFAIVLKDGDRLVGNIGIYSIRPVNRKAMVGLFIGEEEYRSKGYGAEALRLILSFGFNTLNLHNIALKVHSDNTRAIACYKKAGFTECGRQRESEFKNGAYVDDVMMDILDREFKPL